MTPPSGSTGPTKDTTKKRRNNRRKSPNHKRSASTKSNSSVSNDETSSVGSADIVSMNSNTLRTQPSTVHEDIEESLPPKPVSAAKPQQLTQLPTSPPQKSFIADPSFNQTLGSIIPTTDDSSVDIDVGEVLDGHSGIQRDSLKDPSGSTDFDDTEELLKARPGDVESPTKPSTVGDNLFDESSEERNHVEFMRAEVRTETVVGGNGSVLQDLEKYDLGMGLNGNQQQQQEQQPMTPTDVTYSDDFDVSSASVSDEKKADAKATTTKADTSSASVKTDNENSWSEASTSRVANSWSASTTPVPRILGTTAQRPASPSKSITITKDDSANTTKRLGRAGDISFEYSPEVLSVIERLEGRTSNNNAQISVPEVTKPTRTVSASPSRIPVRSDEKLDVEVAAKPPTASSSATAAAKKDVLNRLNQGKSASSRPYNTMTSEDEEPDTTIDEISHISNLSAMDTSSRSTTTGTKRTTRTKRPTREIRKEQQMEEELVRLRTEVEQLRIMADSQSIEVSRLVTVNSKKERELEQTRNELEYTSKKLMVMEAGDMGKAGPHFKSHSSPVIARSNDDVAKVHNHNNETHPGDVSLSDIMAGPIGEKLTKEELDRMRKEVVEQEMLIKGYQTENEKLVSQVKSLSTQLKDIERNWTSKYENTIIENTQLKNQLIEREAETRALVARTRSEALAESLQNLPRDDSQMDEKEKETAHLIDLEREVEVLRDENDTKEKEMEVIKQQMIDEIERGRVLEMELIKLREKLRRLGPEREDASPPPSATTATASKDVGQQALQAAQEELVKSHEKERKRLQTELETQGREYEIRIREFERQLDKREEHVREMIRDIEKKNSIIERQEEVVRELKEQLKSKSTVTVAESRPNNKQNNNNNNAPPTPSFNVKSDSARIKDLQRHIQELESILKKRLGAAAGAAAIKEARQSKGNSAKSGHLGKADSFVDLEAELAKRSSELVSFQQRMDVLEEEKRLLNEEAEQNMIALREEYERLRIVDEERIRELETRLSKSVEMGTMTASAVAMDLVVNVEKLVKQTITDPVEGDDENDEGFRAVALETLPNTLQSLMKEVERVVLERDLIHKDALAQLSQKDAALREMEIQLRRQKEQWPDEAKAELDRLRKDNITLRSRMEVLEATRQSVQENMMLMMKQAQEESARLALEHHDRALRMLRDETRAQTEMMIDIQLNAMKKQLAIAETDAFKYKARIESLEMVITEMKEQLSGKDRDTLTLLSQLREENSRLRDDLSRAREAQAPEMRHFDKLADRIREIESRTKRRENDLRYLKELDGNGKENTSPARSNVDNSKNNGAVADNTSAKEQSKTFRKELEKVAKEINDLRRSGLL